MTSSTTKQASAQPARQRILNSAHDLFYRDGIRATGIDRVIAASGVSKLTFYRHFPSKNDLIRAYLDDRHERWMSWFRSALERHAQTSDGPVALLPALGEWFSSEAYRGCAFINTTVELGGAQPDILEVSRRHKAEMTDAIETLLPPSLTRRQLAEAMTMAVDGAIVQAQRDGRPDDALANLAMVIEALTRAERTG